MSIIDSSRPGPAGAAPATALTPYNGFYSPASLRSAYKLTAASARDGAGRTVAIVDAFSDPRAAADLAKYRAHFHLGACSTASGCLRIVNEHGHAGPLPRPNADWAFEESIDLDMVSALCPHCHILLVEARTNLLGPMGTAEDTAVRMGAKYVSNSWAAGEFLSQDGYARYFDHPGVAIDFASGDSGYGPAFPTDLQYVTAVGGTALRHAPGRRGWTESVWGAAAYGAEGTGSGCSALEAKPSWQRADASSPDGCLNRTENDVAAVGDPVTGVAVYDTYQAAEMDRPDWNQTGGTSVATPIITAIYALAGVPQPRTYPSEYPYLHAASLFDIRSGVNGTCEAYRRYLCHGGPGYNGPAGLGTPDGTAAFAGGSRRRVTVLDPGTADRSEGSRLTLRVTGLDSAAKASLRWTASGLPAGLAIRGIAHTTDALITGKLPAVERAYRVAVSATDGVASGVTHFTIVVVPSLRDASSLSGHLVLTSTNMCADAEAGNGQPVRVAQCSDAATQDWSYQAAPRPAAAGRLVHDGRCLTVTGRGVISDPTADTPASGSDVLARCDGSMSQRWSYRGLGVLQSASTGECLAVPNMSRTARLSVARCDSTKRRKYQSWKLPAGSILSAVGGLCLNAASGSSAFGSQVTVARCRGSNAQEWSLSSTGTIRSANGYCLDGSGSTVLTYRDFTDGTPVILNFCSRTDLNQIWVPGPGGELINGSSGRCLADYRGQGGGTGLVVEDCYGDAGELWGVN
jgi:Ricin-type beta-trefoil lectin domain/Subtilase family